MAAEEAPYGCTCGLLCENGHSVVLFSKLYLRAHCAHLSARYFSRVNTRLGI